MFFHKILSQVQRGENGMRKLKQGLVYGMVLLFAAGCSASLDGGSIVASFSGIGNAIVLGPETVEVSWTLNSTCSSYQIFELSSSTSSSVSTVSVPPTKISVTSDHTYNFAVGCTDSLGALSGLNFSQSISTWSKFTGVVTSALDTNGTSPVIDLNWTYLANTGTAFQVYAQASQVPGDLSSWQLTQPNGYGTAYSETPICVTYNNSIKIGPGGDCNPASLVSGNNYNFKVVAKYPDGQYSSDLLGNGTSIQLPASFTPPNCVLTTAGLGADASSSYLFLRCSSATGVTGVCSLANISTTAYQAINGVRTVVSDTLVGGGTLRIQPQISTTAANDRIVTNLEIDYTCNGTTPASKAVVRYDGTSAQYPQPFLKYGSTNYEAAPVQSYTQSPSFLGGGAMAIGDFNCDGKPDLAVGLPYVAYNFSPYMNQNAESGAVKIYYDYAVSATGAITSASTEYISFRDLASYSHFGMSLSSGNINKDTYYDSNTQNIYSCDDLIIGAPGTAATNSTAPVTPGTSGGTAYIFYGQPTGLPQPLDSAGLAVNGATCSGTITNQICSPVRLQPNAAMPSNFLVDPALTNRNGTDEIGFSVSYIRDFNADGYGDVAIGNPYCQWDGYTATGYAPIYPAIAPIPAQNVGCVYVFWGGPQGLQSTYVGKTPDGATSLNSSFVKVYPPFPQAGMHFGWSISGGGDVDGRLPVPVQQNGGSGVILANGNDFVVSAPDFVYTADSTEGKGNTLSWTVDETSPRSGCSGGTGGSCPVDPIVMQGGNVNSTTPSLIYDNKITPPWNGAWAQSTSAWNGATAYPTPANTALQGSTGIAFLYLGRYAFKSYNLTVLNNFDLFPNQMTTDPGLDTLMQYLSANLQDRQNGSQYLSATPTVYTAPKDSFYNCGPRGGSLVQDSNSYFTHVSCLAGRNNFSVIYPPLKSTDAAVTRFGTEVKIAGARDQNAVALYQLGSLISASGYNDVQDGLLYDLVTLAQGTTSERIRGTSLWELGVKGLNVAGAQDQTCETTHDGTVLKFATSSCSSYAGVLSRSILDESYSFPTSSWNPQANAAPLTDINKDGYADVLVTSNSQLYTFFGNYAADFSYQAISPASGDHYSTSSSCNVTRSNSLPNNTFSTTNPNAATGSPTPAPFATFYGRSSALNIGGTSEYQITGQYPQYFSPPSGYYVRASFLDDTTAISTALSFNYQTIGTRSSLGNNCYPQVKNYGMTATSLAVADMDNDGIIDAVIGFGGYNTNKGMTVTSISGYSGNGLSSDMDFSVATNSTQLGSSLAVTNWKFMDGSSRRDIFAGAVGYSDGAGSIYAFSGANSVTIGATSTTQLLENSNSPQVLNAQYSKIIGDVNGDGYDDIWVPVKQIGTSGTVSYDAIVYFGSSFGPVTYSFCINKLSSLTNLSGGSLSASDCQGATASEVALLSGTQIHLPQYISKPTGVSANWSLSVFAAGDVNRDGYKDVAIFDAMGGLATPTSALYLFFGTSSGIKNGQPLSGSSLNQSPQLVSQNPEIVGTQYNNTTNTYGYNTVAPPSFVARLVDPANPVGVPGVSLQGRPIVHGDFNGDGYEDIAFGVPYGASPAHNPTWLCPAGAPEAYCSIVAAGTPYPAGIGGLPGAGYVVVLYGSAGGYQTPVSSGTGLPIDFESVVSTCNDLYENCTYTANSNQSYLNTWRTTYNTLNYNSGSGAYTLDTTKTACDPSSVSTNIQYYTCFGSLVRSPLFYDTAAGGQFPALQYKYFGSSLTVADVNHDGIDDLIVGSPRFNNAGYIESAVGSGKKIFGVSADDNVSKGGVFIYYGGKGTGVLAPDASQMLGDTGMGLGGASAAPSPSAIAFSIYPYYPSSNYPTLDSNTAHTDAYRNFGINLSSGDFDGDGFDDLAITSGNGQLYVYYGPICPADNSKTVWTGTVYQNPNLAIPVNGLGPDGVVRSSPFLATDCTVLNLNNPNGAFLPNSSNGNTLTTLNGGIAAATKTIYPQTIAISGALQASEMGSVLISRKPIRSPATTTVVSNPGNINGDAEGTSDLVVGTGFMSDPNVTLTSSWQTGLGYILFGHKTPVTGSMTTTPGLYVGTASYNGNITTTVLSGTNYYYYTPLLLRPHTSDGSVAGFFYYESTFGDMNGDGTGDFLFPTADISVGADGTPVILGGGFKLYY